MSEKLVHIKVYLDQNTKRVLVEMGDKQLRGHSASRVAGTILENWVWENQPLLKESEIYLRAKPSTDKSETT